MGFQKLIVVLSGSGSTGLLKLSGSFDGVSKVRAECRCDAVKGEAKLYIIADEVTELKLNAAKTVLEMPIWMIGIAIPLSAVLSIYRLWVYTYINKDNTTQQELM